MQTAVEQLGGLDYAFVNAGVAGMGTVLSMPADEWDRVTTVNLRGAFFTLQQAARHIVAQGNGGAIVLTSSSAGIVSDVGFVHYSVAKIGIRHMARVAARELGKYGIRVERGRAGPDAHADDGGHRRVAGIHRHHDRQHRARAAR